MALAPPVGHRRAPRPVLRVGAHAVLVISAGVSAWQMWHGIARPMVAVVAFALSYGALGLALAIPALRRTLSMTVVVGISAALIVAAVASKPSSDDYWAYLMYGRTVTVYRQNPYKHSPAEYRGDPMFQRVDPLYRETRAEYGPLWIQYSVAVAGAVGTHPLPARLVFQITAALAMVAAVVLVARRTRSPAAVALVGINPLIVRSAVNGAHNDMLVGLGLLAAVLLAERKRSGWAVVAATAAVLIKASAILGLAGLLIWIWRRHGWRRAAVAGSPGLILLLGEYALSGGPVALEPLVNQSNQVNGQSVWNVLRPHGLDHLLVRDVYSPLGAVGHLPTVALVAIAAMGALIVASRRDEGSPTMLVAGPLVCLLLLALYTGPWYAAWVLPVLALRPAALETAVLVAAVAVIDLASEFHTAVVVWVLVHLFTPSGNQYASADVAVDSIAILVRTAAVVALTVAALRRLRRPAPAVLPDPGWSTTAAAGTRPTIGIRTGDVDLPGR